MRLTTIENRLAFAVDFAQEQLEGFTNGDWLNLRDDLWGFFGWTQPGESTALGSGAASAPNDIGDYGDMSISDSARAAIAATQRDSARLIRAWTSRGASATSRYVNVGNVRLRFVGRERLMLGGVRDLYLLELFTLLTDGGDRI